MLKTSGRICPTDPWTGWGLPVAMVLMAILPFAHTMVLRNLCATTLILISLYGFYRLNWPARFPTWRAWSIYLVAVVLSLIWAVDFNESLGDIKSELLHGLLAFLIGINWFGRQPALVWVRRAAWLMTAVILIDVGLFASLQWLKTGLLPDMVGGYLVGVGKLSSYLVMTIPILLLSLGSPGKSRWVAIWLLIGSVVALILSANRASFLVVAVQVLVAASMIMPRLGRAKRRMVVAGVIIATLVAMGLTYYQFMQRAQIVAQGKQDTVATVDHSIRTDPRWIIWSHTLHNPRHPWWHGGGFGITTFKLLYPELHQQPGSELHTHAHNVFLNKYVQLGLPGLLAWCLLLIVTLRYLFRGVENAELNAWRIALAMSLFGALMKVQTDDFFHRDVGWAFWMLAGVAVGLFSHRTGGRAVQVGHQEPA
ncbi:O-antigen ligase [Chitinivorax tropicus]|uniref:O-antigen ligase n=1 Tax=Chitinivorax tropicus TaxID=714531 RepID=A0A840MK23_9PROT|nr:O-antigen ligase family protein [Chitinivorax tropicus]MBB5017052.1 O-antigen ligase [Chitinivorax tropicus]